MTAINKKIDLQHSQEFSDIVGGIVASDYLEDETGGRVECVGELYVRETGGAPGLQADEATGSSARSRWSATTRRASARSAASASRARTNTARTCASSRGGEFGGKPVFEILHGVTFTGLGLLDRKGADENARILQVASVQNQSDQSQPEGDSAMEDKNKPNDDPPPRRSRRGQEETGGGKDGRSGSRVAELEKENRQLKAQVAELQKRVQELEASKRPPPAAPGRRSC